MKSCALPCDLELQETLGLRGRTLRTVKTAGYGQPIILSNSNDNCAPISAILSQVGLECSTREPIVVVACRVCCMAAALTTSEPGYRPFYFGPLRNEPHLCCLTGFRTTPHTPNLTSRIHAACSAPAVPLIARRLWGLMNVPLPFS